MAVYIKKTIDGVPKGIPLTTDSGQGLPLGAWTSFEDDKPRNGYLKAGTTFNQADYPALYTMLGTNVVPDKGYGLDWDNAQAVTLSTSDYIVTKPGWIVGWFTPNVNQQVSLYINGIETTYSYNHNNTSFYFPGVLQIEVSKGDIIKTNINPYNQTLHFVPYLHPMFIKAVIGPIEDSAADQVVQNINNSRSYSTSEVNTGKKWIDGKPIYRKVYVINATARSDIPTGLPAGSEVLQMWVRGKWDSNTSSGNYTVTDSQSIASPGVPFYMVSEDGTSFQPMSLSSGHYVKDITIEYTKGTD